MPYLGGDYDCQQPSPYLPHIRPSFVQTINIFLVVYAGFITKKMLKNVLLAGVMGQDNWWRCGAQETSSFPQEPFIWQLTFLQRVQECNMSCRTAAQIQPLGKSLTVMDILDMCKYAEF